MTVYSFQCMKSRGSTDVIYLVDALSDDMAIILPPTKCTMWLYCVIRGTVDH